MSHTPTLAELAEQENRLRFTSFDHEIGLALGLHLVRAAQDSALAITVSVRRGHQRLFHVALAGTSADNDTWIDRKSRVVDHFGHSSLYVGTQFRESGKVFEEAARLDPLLYAAHGGVFPVIVAGVGPVGTVGVSGLPQLDDHAFVVAQLQAFLSAHTEVRA